MTLMNNKNNNIARSECPVCFEKLTGETKIAQFISGHHLCWTCKNKMKDNQCPSCQLVDGDLTRKAT